MEAANQIKIHIDQVTTQFLPASVLSAGNSLNLDFVPGRTYEIPVPANAGDLVSIRTSSRDFADSIMVLLAPDGTPLTGSDDFKFYHAGFDWTAPQTAVYRLQVTTFESVSTGRMTVSRR